MRIGIPQEAKTLNPLLDSNTIDGFVARFMFEPLISAYGTGTPVPMLVSAVPQPGHGISADGLTITYKLRPGIRWSDGHPLTSKDVRFSWSAIMNGANNVVSRHGYDDIASLTTPDALTVVVHLKKPMASFVNTFFAESDQPYEIVPEHVLDKEHSINTIAFNGAPTVSDGPFKFVRWQHGDRIVLTANDSFFMGKPKLAGVDVITIANENTGVNQLRTKAIDYLYQPSIATYPQLHGNPDINLVFNKVQGYEGMVFNTRRAPMSDPRFRLAVAYAIDKATLVRDLAFGQETIATEDLPDWMWANDHSMHPLPYDLYRAKALLTAAHVKTPVSLVLVTDSANVTHKRSAVLLQSMLRKAGIELEVKTYPGDLLYAGQGAGGILTGGNYDIALWPWFGGLDPDNSSLYACENRPPHGWNVSFYCNAEMDAQQTIALTHYDRPTREAAYHRIEQILARDNPTIIFWWQRQQEALRTNVRGFSPNPATESWNAWEWSVSR